MDNNNRSLDLTELLSRVHKQAVLVGGSHDGKRAPLPPMIYDGDHPKYLCQPGRPFDETYYHYGWTGDTTYVYMDHCDTLPGMPHHTDQIQEEEERRAGTRALFLACAGIVGAFSAGIMYLLINGVVTWAVS